MNKNYRTVGYKWTYTGTLQTKVIMILPFLLYLSRSTIRKPGKKRGGIVYALHLTPFFTIGLNWGTNVDLETNNDD